MHVGARVAQWAFHMRPPNQLDIARQLDHCPDRIRLCRQARIIEEEPGSSQDSQPGALVLIKVRSSNGIPLPGPNGMVLFTPFTLTNDYRKKCRMRSVECCGNSATVIESTGRHVDEKQPGGLSRSHRAGGNAVRLARPTVSPLGPSRCRELK